MKCLEMPAFTPPENEEAHEQGEAHRSQKEPDDLGRNIQLPGKLGKLVSAVSDDEPSREVRHPCRIEKDPPVMPFFCADGSPCSLERGFPIMHRCPNKKEQDEGHGRRDKEGESRVETVEEA